MQALLLALGLASAAQQPTSDEPLLILPVEGPDASASAMEASLARALRSRLGELAVVTTQELNVALSAERTKDVLGCDSVQCFEDLLGALGGRFALGVQLNEGQPLSDVVLILRDLTDVARVFRLERRAPSLMPARLGGLAEDLATGLAAAAGWDDAPSTAAPRALGGTLTVRSEPTGGRIRLNGEPIGQAPLTLSGLASGSYQLSVVSLGYERHTDSFELAPAASLELEARLEPLRDWHFAVQGGFSPDTSAVNDAVLWDVGIAYTREIFGPLQAGGLAGYAGFSGTVNGQTRVHHGAMIGGQISVGTCLCMSSLTKFAELSASTNGDDADRLQLDEEQSSDWALVGVRAKAKLLYRTPDIVAVEIGGELNMLSVMHIDIYYATLLSGRNQTIDGDRFALGSDMVGFRFGLGFSAFYRRPESP